MTCDIINHYHPKFMKSYVSPSLKPIECTYSMTNRLFQGHSYMYSTCFVVTRSAGLKEVFCSLYTRSIAVLL